MLRIAPGDKLDQLSAGELPRLVPGGAEPWPTDPEQYLADYQARRTAEWQQYYSSPGDPVTALELEEYFRQPACLTSHAAAPGQHQRAGRPSSPTRPKPARALAMCRLAARTGPGYILLSSGFTPPNQQPQDWPDGILRGSGA